MSNAPIERCELPPPGWWCSRGKGHEGPCAARPQVQGPPPPSLAELAYSGQELATFVRDVRDLRAKLKRYSANDLDALERSARWICMHSIGPDAWRDTHEGAEPHGLTLRDYTNQIEELSREAVLRDVAGFNEAGAAIADALRGRYALQQARETP